MVEKKIAFVKSWVGSAEQHRDNKIANQILVSFKGGVRK